MWAGTWGAVLHFRSPASQPLPIHVSYMALWPTIHVSYMLYGCVTHAATAGGELGRGVSRVSLHVEGL